MTKQHEQRRPRRLTPPISALAAFEAVARRGSFTAAADELALTQSAVSRQVGALEQLLDIELIEKNRRRQIVLTASGVFYAEYVRQMLSDLAGATAEAIALGGQGRVLRLGIPPTFGSLWLIPRMPSFFSAHPDIVVEFSTRIPSRSNAGLESLHALIDFVPAPGTGAQWDKLIDLELWPLATPQICASLKQSDKSDLANIHLLVHPSERASWSELFDNPDLAFLRSQPMLSFESYTMLFQAAVSGLGIALAPTALAEDELRNKRLLPVSDIAIKAQTSGYLVYHQENSNYMPLRAFRTWLFDALKNYRVPSV